MSARRRIPGQDTDQTYTVVTVGNNTESVNKFTNNWTYTNHQNSPYSKETSESNYCIAEAPIEFIMTARDRTAEFSNAIRSMQGRNIARAANIRDPRKARQLQSYSEFMGIAKLIGKNIANTYSKLEKLTHCNFYYILTI